MSAPPPCVSVCVILRAEGSKTLLAHGCEAVVGVSGCFTVVHGMPVITQTSCLYMRHIFCPALLRRSIAGTDAEINSLLPLMANCCAQRLFLACALALPLSCRHVTWTCNTVLCLTVVQPLTLPSGCREFASDIESVLEMLPHREGEVLALRYGLFSGEPLSLSDVAKVLKMSAEGVRKNELQAFRYGLNPGSVV